MEKKKGSDIKAVNSMAGLERKIQPATKGTVNVTVDRPEQRRCLRTRNRVCGCSGARSATFFGLDCQLRSRPDFSVRIVRSQVVFDLQEMQAR